MTTNQIQTRISRCIDLKRVIADAEAEMKENKAALVAEASYRTGEHSDTDGGGWSWRFQDADGNEVCVTQPGRKLKAKLDPEAKGFDKIKELAGRCFMQLFMQVPAYRPVEEFQAKAAQYLPKPEANKLIKLVTTEAAPTVSFEVAAAKETA
jgi:hypothetical protein